jgi:hypothetical protein
MSRQRADNDRERAELAAALRGDGNGNVDSDGGDGGSSYDGSSGVGSDDGASESSSTFETNYDDDGAASGKIGCKLHD